MKKKYYHATNYDGYIKIISDQKIIPKLGAIYLCDDPKDACKFLFVRGIKNIYTFEVKLDENDVSESFDHDPEYFQCKAYSYFKEIPFNDFNKILSWDFNK